MSPTGESSGSLYQLAIELSSAPDDARLTAALESLWAHPSLAGPRPPARGTDEPADLHPAEVELVRCLWGELAMPDTRQLACMAAVVREQAGSDWLDLCVATGAIEAVYPLEYPLARWENEPLFDMLDSVFLKLADSIFKSAHFELALIGEERSGLLHAVDFVDRPDVARFYLQEGGLLLSPPLLEQAPGRVLGERRASGLWWLPPIERLAHGAPTE